jgi:DNA-binding NtrC family response regulator
MPNNRHILVVSSRIENKNTLLGALHELPVSTFAVATIEHAFEVLLSSPIDLVFCEENVTDGSYRELLSAMHASNKMTPFVLILCTGKWEECLEAVRLGAADVLRCPLEPTDINLTLVRAMRDKEYADGGLYVSPCPTLQTSEPAGLCEYAGGIGEVRMLIRRPTL